MIEHGIICLQYISKHISYGLRLSSVYVFEIGKCMKAFLQLHCELTINQKSSTLVMRLS